MRRGKNGVVYWRLFRDRAIKVRLYEKDVSENIFYTKLFFTSEKRAHNTTVIGGEGGWLVKNSLHGRTFMRANKSFVENSVGSLSNASMSFRIFIDRINSFRVLFSWRSNKRIRTTSSLRTRAFRAFQVRYVIWKLNVLNFQMRLLRRIFCLLWKLMIIVVFVNWCTRVVPIDRWYPIDYHL